MSGAFLLTNQFGTNSPSPFLKCLLSEETILFLRVNTIWKCVCPGGDRGQRSDEAFGGLKNPVPKYPSILVGRTGTPSTAFSHSAPVITRSPRDSYSALRDSDSALIMPLRLHSIRKHVEPFPFPTNHFPFVSLSVPSNRTIGRTHQTSQLRTGAARLHRAIDVCSFTLNQSRVSAETNSKMAAAGAGPSHNELLLLTSQAGSTFVVSFFFLCSVHVIRQPTLPPTSPLLHRPGGFHSFFVGAQSLCVRLRVSAHVAPGAPRFFPACAGALLQCHGQPPRG